jgi:hypothetical protein
LPLKTRKEGLGEVGEDRVERDRVGEAGLMSTAGRMWVQVGAKIDWRRMRGELGDTAGGGAKDVRDEERPQIWARKAETQPEPELEGHRVRYIMEQRREGEARLALSPSKCDCP